MPDRALRAEIVALARDLDARGLNRGSSGNISARDGAALLITPSGVPAGRMEPEMLARMKLDRDDGGWEGPLKPSTEWRFHLDLMRARPEFNAVVHTHSPFATILAIARRPIPAIHYMMAAFGGPEIRCSGYACFGTAALSDAVVAAMAGRAGCLMANHGMIVGAPSLARAGWLAAELEALAHQYVHLLQIGGGYVLSASDLAEAAAGFAGYSPEAGRG
jgi:L-fuculose-phosphate aldolase